MRHRLSLLPVALSFSLGGCLLGPDFVRPEVPVPESYRDGQALQESVANLSWWHLFEDEVLRDLISIALEENKDLGIALERVAEARAALGFTKTDQLPRFGYSGSAARFDPSDRVTPLGSGPTSDFSVGLDAFFEVDLWGRLRRSTEAAQAELLASDEAYRSVTITLIADVASTYFLLRDLDNQLEISLRTRESRRAALKIIRDRFFGGVTDMLDVHQAEIEEATTDAAVSAQERAVAQTEHALSVLLGRNPGSIPRGRSLLVQGLPIDVPAGLPSEILRRRPDILAAEYAAHAETARIGVAEALRFPTVSLTSAFGYQSDELEDTIKSSAEFWSVGAGLVGPLFEFGRNVRRVEIQQARAQQAVLAYERSVLRAFQEVEDALVAIATFRGEYQARARQVQSARGATRLARALYDEEFASYIEVLDTERSLFNAELEESRVLRSSLQAIVQLYKALGGGWPADAEAEAAPRE